MLNYQWTKNIMKKLSVDFEKIKAESLLSSCQDSIENINIDFQGVFSRNYENDIINIVYDFETSDNKSLFQLSRDSLFHILPEGLFFKEDVLRLIAKEKNEVKFKAEAERIIKEKQKLLFFFQPFDKTYFKLRLELEKKLNEIAANRTKILTDKLFDIFNINTENQFIRKITPLLPIASEIRGNSLIWKDILKNIFFPAKIETRILKKRNSTGRLKQIFKSDIHIEKLSTKEFRMLKKEVDVFALFFYEWFLPVDMGYDIKVKDAKEKFILGKTMTLDYNTYLNN